MFGGARKLLKGFAAPEAPRTQYYVVECPQGHRLRGVRTDGYQAIRCPSCGLGLFVLPRSPLPDPPAPAEGTLRGRARRPTVASPPVHVVEDEPIQYAEAEPVPDANTEVEIVWLDESARQPAVLSDDDIPSEYRTRERVLASDAPGEPPVLAPDNSSSAQASNSGTRPKARPRAAAQAKVTEAVETGKLRPSPSGATRRTRAAAEPAPATVPDPGTITLRVPPETLAAWVIRHRFAFIILAVILLTTLTIGYRTWRSDLERQPLVADLNLTQGKEALDRGDFDAAKQKLALAVRAFERMGGKDERTTQARQLAREAALFADLSNRQLDEIVDEAGRADPAAWPRRFDVAYKSRAIIIETQVAGPPRAGESPGAYQLTYHILVGRGPKPSRTGVLDLDGFKLFEGRTMTKGDSVIFGARLAGVDYRGGEWDVRLEPDSGVYLTQFKALQVVGWTPEQEPSISKSRSRPDAEEWRP